jgi:hypothetical protein
MTSSCRHAAISMQGLLSTPAHQAASVQQILLSVTTVGKQQGCDTSQTHLCRWRYSSGPCT